MTPVERPSPNHDARGSTPVDTLVLHYTGMESAEAALARMCDPTTKVSAHWLVDEDGTVYALVGEHRRAWHAGLAHWRGHTDVNARSIGIELQNPGHEFGYRAFPEPQMVALVGLCSSIASRHPIVPRNVVGHSDVAPARKCDPGELFDWRRLAAAGIGVWPSAAEGASADDGPPDMPTGEVQARLAAYGYEVAASGGADDATRTVVAAFQRHFRPALITGEPDAGTCAVLRALGDLTEA